MKIIGIGNALVDVLVRLSDDAILDDLGFPKGGMVLIDQDKQQEIDAVLENSETTMTTGGSAANTMLALAHLGAYAGYIGRIGEDAHGNFFRDNCLRSGIHPHFISCNDHTGVANTFITPDGQRTFGTLLGAAQMEPHDIIPQMLNGYDILHIEGYLVQNHDTIEAVCQFGRQLGLIISIDLGSYNIVRDDRDFFKYLLCKYVDIVFANEEEALAYTGTNDTFASSAAFVRDCSIAVIKLGSRGACAMSASDMKFVYVPACKVANVIDTTAAGDFFAGGFLYAQSQGCSLEKSLQIGAHLSENVIQVMGTELLPETWDKIREFVQTR